MPGGATTHHSETYNAAADVLLVHQPEATIAVVGSRRSERYVMVPPPTSLAVPVAYDSTEFERGKQTAVEVAEGAGGRALLLAQDGGFYPLVVG